MMVARSAACRAARRPASSSSLISAPSAARLSSCLAAPAASGPSITQIRSTLGSRASTSLLACRWAGVSAISARAPESPRIHSTCSAEEVS